MKKASEHVSKSIIVPAGKTWEVIGAVGGVDKWFASMIQSCKVEGDKRHCITKDGIPLKENILEVNAQAMEFKFAIPEQSMLPVQNIVEVMKVKSDGNGGAIVDWSATFDVEAKDEEMAKEAFRNLWTMGINELEEYILNEN